jgi:hypothetical protein
MESPDGASGWDRCSCLAATGLAAVSDVAAAERLGVARSTVGSATERHVERSETEDDRYWESPAGHAQLHRLVVTLPLVMTLCTPCGVAQVAQVLELSGLGRYAATSYGVHPAFSRQLTAKVRAFAHEQSVALGAAMPRRRVTMALDEVFFAGLPTLVALEPASNFLLVEQGAARCDEASWTAATTEALAGLR